MSAFFAHESSLGRKFSILAEVCLDAQQTRTSECRCQHILLRKPKFVRENKLFIGKSTAFSTKTPCNMQLNAVRFAAKRKVKWCKTQGEMMQNADFSAAKNLTNKMRITSVWCENG